MLPQGMLKLSSWNIVYGADVDEDMANLDGSVRPQVLSAIRKVSQNPLPKREGGYGTELGNKDGLNLTGCLKIKLRKAGIRVVYTLERTEQDMKIVIVGIRADLDVYRRAVQRLGR